MAKFPCVCATKNFCVQLKFTENFTPQHSVAPSSYLSSFCIATYFLPIYLFAHFLYAIFFSIITCFTSSFNHMDFLSFFCLLSSHTIHHKPLQLLS